MGFSISLLSQPTDKNYYSPYNFPNKYESDKMNKNFNMSFVFPVFGGHYYNSYNYADFARIKIIEYMNINFGIGVSGGWYSNKTVHYTIESQEAYTLKTANFIKALLGGGLTFRLADPINLSARCGYLVGKENYITSEIRPAYLYNYWDKVTYSQSSNFKFRSGFFYNFTLLYAFKAGGLSVSRGAFFMASGIEFMNSIGIVFPIGN